LAAPLSFSGDPARSEKSSAGRGGWLLPPRPLPARTLTEASPRSRSATRVAARRLVLGGAVLLLVVGLLALAETVVTIAWQEPISALSAHRHQQELGDELTKTQRAMLSPASLADLKRMTTQRQRIAALAEQLNRRAGPGDALGRILIPTLGVKFVFVADTTSKSLKKGPGHYDSTVLPGQRGTVGIAGHRTTYLAPFRDLNRLRKGEQIVLTMPYGRFSYTVEDSAVVSTSNATALRPVNHGRLVLTTCTPPFSAVKRLVVTAREKSQVPLGAAVGDPFPFAL
jgi:sortase A